MHAGAAPSALNKDTQIGLTGTLILKPPRSAGELMALLPEVIWRKPLSHIFCMGSRPTFSISARTKAPSSPSIADHTAS